jgi:hypothetical protein
MDKFIQRLPEELEMYIYEFLRPDMSNVLEPILFEKGYCERDIADQIIADLCPETMQEWGDDYRESWEYEDILDQGENDAIRYFQKTILYRKK